MKKIFIAIFMSTLVLTSFHASTPKEPQPISNNTSIYNNFCDVLENLLESTMEDPKTIMPSSSNLVTPSNTPVNPINK